ncbi:MAG: protein-tyrosine phosphatase-like protein [Benniella sp.]|nr:MAG: protein-tyrosine phosphatase-like protein [Benniella sp.]
MVLDFPDDFTYKVIQVPDLDYINLIQHFPDTFKFIDDAISNGGKVLVHCMAGVSRSATIVTAYMMKHKKMSASDALVAVQSIRPIVDPNDGFVRQLILYDDIQYDVSVNNTAYRRFLMAVMAEQRQTIGYIREMTLASDPLSAVAVAAAASAASAAAAAAAAAVTIESELAEASAALVARPQPPLKCKKCRRALVARDSIIAHIPGQGQNAFQYRKRNATLNVSQAIQSDSSAVQPQSVNACQSFFIEPIEWIQGLDELDGKISCPKCDSKLGSFNWAGEQCSCGSWVTPAFMLHKGKVDA